MSDHFIREFELETVGKTLELHQKVLGDVGYVVWDASMVLAKYLEVLHAKNNEIFACKKIIELGAGVGCVGLTATCLGADVILTDLEKLMPLLETNIKINEKNWENDLGKAEAAVFNWGEEFNISFTPDYVLLADCIYYIESVDPLIRTLKQLSKSNTKILLSQEMRDSDVQKNCWKHFLERVKEHFQIRFVPMEEQNVEISSPDILIAVLTLL